MQERSKAVGLVAVSTICLCSCSSGCPAASPPKDEPTPPAASAPAAPAPVVVSQSHPAAFQFDGVVSEWRDTAPLARLDPADTLQGQAKPASASDAAAVVWMAFTREGVTLAADVTDHDVALSETEPGVEQKDHMALWLAFPPAEMPAIGLQYIQDTDGEATEIPDAGWCGTEAGKQRFEGAEPCRTWVAAQVTRRVALMRLFTRRFLVSSAGVQEVYASAIGAPIGHEPLPFPWPTGCEGCTAKVVPRAGGYSIEARLPLSALPATASDPSSDFRYRVDVTDVDTSGSQSVLSTERGRPSEVSAQARLDPPRAFESTPPMVARLTEVDDGSFVFPAETVRVAYGFLNRLRGHDSPDQVDSPSVAEVKFPDFPEVSRRGVDVYAAPRYVGLHGPVRELVAFRGGALVASQDFTGMCQGEPVEYVFSKERGPCVLVAFLCSGMRNPVGVGPCGACPSLGYDVVAIDATGRMTGVGEGSLDCSEDIGVARQTNSGFTVRCRGEFAEEEGSLRVRWSQFTCPK